VSAIDRETLLRFVALATERLPGDWVILGGTVLPLLGVEQRVTFDIDIAGPKSAGNRELLEVLAIADELGLAVEAINQSAAFFLHRVPGWQDNLVEVARGSAGRVMRPDATLFVLLKLGRLSESDLLDCLAMLRLAEAQNERPDRARLVAEIASQRAGRDVSAGRLARLEALRSALSESDGVG